MNIDLETIKAPIMASQPSIHLSVHPSSHPFHDESQFSQCLTIWKILAYFLDFIIIIIFFYLVCLL